MQQIQLEGIQKNKSSFNLTKKVLLGLIGFGLMILSIGLQASAAVNTSQLSEITDTVMAFVPTILTVSIIGWLLDTFENSFR